MELHTNIPAHEYHQHPAVSKHGLDSFRKAPALYRFIRNNPLTPTPSMRFGSLYHTAILEPEKIDAGYTFVPEDAPRRPSSTQRKAKKPSPETIAAIEWWDEFEIKVNGREVMEFDDLEKVKAMRAALMQHTAARNAITDQRQHVEASLFWNDPTTGVECRARPDLLRTDGWIVDLKTAADASPDAFQRAAFNYSYHRQAAFYLDGWKLISGEAPKGFIFVVQETEPPFLTAVYVASPAMIELGRSEIRSDLERFAECLRTDTWPGLPEAPQELTLPRWALPPVAA